MSNQEKFAVEAQNAATSNNVFQGAPTFFRANCLTAQLGGNHGYAEAGWHLGIHCANLLESDGHDDWARKMEELATLLDTTYPDDRKVVAWFKREFPKCVALIPSRRRTQFLKGIYAVHEDRGITS